MHYLKVLRIMPNVLHSLQTKILHFVVLHFVDLILLRKCFILISFLKNILSTESPLHNLLAKSLISTVLKKKRSNLQSQDDFLSDIR